MGEFGIDTKGIQRQILEGQKVTGKMEHLIERVNAIAVNSILSSASFSAIKKAIETEKKLMEAERSTNKALFEALQQIKQQYEETEKKIVEAKKGNNTMPDIVKDSAGKPVSGKDRTFLDKAEDFLKKLVRYELYFTSLGIDISNLKLYISQELLAAVYSKKDFNEAVQESLYKFIQEHVYDSSVLAAMALLTLANTISSETIQEHRAHNDKVWKEKQNEFKKEGANQDYIERQYNMSDILYGKQSDKLNDLLFNGNELSGADNACEVIAAYNALVSLNNGTSPVSFPALLEYFEGKGMMLDGYFGTSPESIAAYFESSGYDTRILVGNGIADKTMSGLQNSYDSYIVTVYNDRNDITNQIHTMSITAEPNGTDDMGNIKYRYVLHNDYTEKNDDKQFDTLAAALDSYDKKYEPISVIGIR